MEHANPLQFSLEFHKQALTKLCRICAQRIKPVKKSGPKTCASYSDIIYVVYGVDIKDDKDDIHPNCICINCYRKCTNHKRRNESQVYSLYKAKAQSTQQLWKEHQDMDCPTCHSYKSSMQGGRPSKHMSTFTKVASDNQDIFLKHFTTIPYVKVESGDLCGMNVDRLKSFVCTICFDVFNTHTVKTQCEHYFCSTCMSRMFSSSPTDNIHCPVCETIVSEDDVMSADKWFRTQLLTLDVVCKKCQNYFIFSAFNDHVCTYDLSSIPSSSASNHVDMDMEITDTSSCNITVHDGAAPFISSTPIHASSMSMQTSPSLMFAHILESASNLDANEEKLHTHLTRRKLKYAADKTTIRCKTKGQVCLTNLKCDNIIATILV